ncbi:MAG: archaemetzincin family Zn-dependent metalloprotease [Candidatus Bathyarchaeota archaeon]|nr:archaemetzincin family Zn-dependent metalloprotease [Candidatus Bathyarchaeota archaeon]MCX8162368.1 archaemetzincin family Zn-dependent metalloprotease [Candidatus Bathyarchaeota archaeon]
MKPIKIIPLGEVDIDLLSWLGRELRGIYDTDVFISVCGLEPPSTAYNVRRRQYLSTLILDSLRSTCKDRDTNVLLVTELDLYVPGLNFVFGQAESPGNYAIVSLHRLRPEFYGEETDSNLLAERLLKEAVHELGHTYGLRHCLNPRCVMRFSNSILEVDAKSCRFCDTCRAELSKLSRKS